MMKRTRRALVTAGALMTIALPVSATEPDGRGPFADVDGSIHETDVAALWEAGITSGCGDWLYCPDEEVSREEVAAFITRALDLARAEARTFDDTEESPFVAEIEALAAAEIADGCGDGRYCPDRSLTRGQMASLLTRALDLPEAGGDPFVDDDGTVHEDNIEALYAAGITRGCGEARYCPFSPVTREQMATFLSRALGLEPPDELPEIPKDVLAELQAPEWPTGPGTEGWRPLVEKYFHPGDVDRALRIIGCESNGDPRARNPYSGASGLFQHMPRYWPERSASAGFGGTSIFDPEANVAAAAHLVYDYPGGGWSHWVCK